MTTTIEAAVKEPADLPQELFRLTLGFLSLPEIARCRAVSKKWRDSIDEGEYSIDFKRPKKIWTLLHQNPIKITLPCHLQLNPVNILQLGERWIIEDANRSCHILPNQYLGEGRLHRFGDKVLFAQNDRVQIFSNNDHNPLEISASSWSIGEECLLVIWEGEAKLFDPNGKLLLRQKEVTSAQFAKDILVTYHPGRTIRIFNLNGERFTKNDVGNVVLTKKGDLVYEHEDQLFHGEMLICELGQYRLLSANDDVAFLGNRNEAHLLQVSLRSKSTKEMPVSSDWLQARCAPDSWEEGLHLLSASVRHSHGCTILTTHKEKSLEGKLTTIVIARGTASPPLELESEGCSSPLLNEDCFWAPWGSQFVVVDTLGGYTLPSKRLEGRSFVSGGNLVTVDQRCAYIRSLQV